MKLSSEFADQEQHPLHEIRIFIDNLILKKEKSLDVQDLPDGGDVLKIERAGFISYRLEKMSCKKSCKGCPHGPYRYGYWREGGKIRSMYIGKRLRQP